jgi:hypothetical protein
MLEIFDLFHLFMFHLLRHSRNQCAKGKSVERIRGHKELQSNAPNREGQ